MYDRAIEKAIFRFADAVIANTDTLAEMWRDRHPIWAEKISVLWNGYDPQDSIEAAPLPARTARVLAHVGNIYQGRTPEPVLASIERLIRSGRVDAARLRIQLIGFLDPNSIAQDRPPFKTLADCKCLEFTGESLPQGQAREFMRGADYLLLIDVNGVAEGLQVPAKIFDYIRVGRPILALTSSGSPVERILARSGIAYACITPCMRPERVDETVLHFLNRSSAPACPTSYFLETFDAERQTRALARRLDKLFAQTDSFRIASPRPRREDL
jgi:glycosyltransferase involved in cell wall biosynthesis